MPEKKIRSTLAELHQELERAGKVDDDLRELLRQVDTDIHALLDSEDRDTADAATLVERIKALAASFAATHPQTERFFQEIVAAFGRLGI